MGRHNMASFISLLAAWTFFITLLITMMLGPGPGYKGSQDGATKTLALCCIAAAVLSIANRDSREK